MCSRLGMCNRLNSLICMVIRGSLICLIKLPSYIIWVVLHLMHLIIWCALCMKKEQLAFNFWYCALFGVPYGPNNLVLAVERKHGWIPRKSTQCPAQRPWNSCANSNHLQYLVERGFSALVIDGYQDRKERLSS